MYDFAPRSHRVGSAKPIARYGRSEQALLVLQKQAGNRAVGTVVQRQLEAPNECTTQEPNNAAVVGIVDEALGGTRFATLQPSALQSAWFRVRNRREDKANCCNAELAAAEHYLYARYAVANHDYGGTEMKALVWSYGLLKFLIPRTGICPQSPNTAGQRQWGYEGANDGDEDWHRNNPEDAADPYGGLSQEP
jgi:hypothetical protein